MPEDFVRQANMHSLIYNYTAMFPFVRSSTGYVDYAFLQDLTIDFLIVIIKTSRENKRK